MTEGNQMATARTQLNDHLQALEVRAAFARIEALASLLPPVEQGVPGAGWASDGADGWRMGDLAVTPSEERRGKWFWEVLGTATLARAPVHGWEDTAADARAAAIRSLLPPEPAAPGVLEGDLLRLHLHEAEREVERLTREREAIEVAFACMKHERDALAEADHALLVRLKTDPRTRDAYATMMLAIARELGGRND